MMTGLDGGRTVPGSTSSNSNTDRDAPSDVILDTSMTARVEEQRLQIQALQAENDSKDVLIAQLRAQLLEAQTSNKASTEATPTKADQDPEELPDDSDLFDLERSLALVQSWLVNKGSFLGSSSEMIQQYCTYLRNELNFPLGRFFVSRMSLPKDFPRSSVWKWEYNPKDNTSSTEQHDASSDVFENKDGKYSDEPFAVLRFQKATSVRLQRAKDSLDNNHIPADCRPWFVEGNYVDYLALPMQAHNVGEFIGAVSWASTVRFSTKHLEFLKASYAAFQTVLQVHANNFVYQTLTNRLAKEVEQRTKALKEAHALQSQQQLQHFAALSHEIRTPLNCIIGLSSLLVETDLDESQLESLRMITRSGDVLVSVVNDVLDYSRLESGHIEIVMEPTNLNGVVEIVLQSIYAKASLRQITIANHLSPDLPSLINTDGSRLQQILYNLLSNAVKFSPEGGTVEFKVDLLDVPTTVIPRTSLSDLGEVDEYDTMVSISIKDYGPGISPDDLERIFRPFHQDGRLHGGTGLGLAITSNLVKSLHGTISAASEVGEWSEFIVNLPCKPVGTSSLLLNSVEPKHKSIPSVAVADAGRSDAIPSSDVKMPQTVVGSTSIPSRTTTVPMVVGKPSSAAPSTSSSVGQQKKTNIIREGTRILVVDDIQVNRKVLVRMLTRIGASSVDMAENGLRACEMQEEHPYDLILMDIEMPVMDGLEATQRILSGRHRPKVVFVTAHALATFHARAVEAGGCGFLTKPINLDKLVSAFSSIDLHMGCRQLRIA